jgi:hypothetical protein
MLVADGASHLYDSHWGVRVSARPPQVLRVRNIRAGRKRDLGADFGKWMVQGRFDFPASLCRVQSFESCGGTELYARVV